VVDSRGKLTGYMEAGLRVYTPVSYYRTETGELIEDYDPKAPGDVDPDTVTAKAQTFRYLAMALKYNADVLEPVTWDIKGSDGQTTNTPLAPDTAAIQLPTKKSDSITNASADIKKNPEDTEGANTGLLYFMVENTDTIELSDDPENGTLLGVVRFKVKEDKYKVDRQTGGKGSYQSVDGTVTSTAVTDDSKWFDDANPCWLLQYATEGEIIGEGMFYSRQQAVYISGETTMYWSDLEADDDPETSTKGYVAAVEKVTGNGASAAVSMDRTCNLLRKQDPADPADPAAPVTYTNCVSFKLANHPSFDATGGGDQAIILYYDWNNALIGVQGVEPGDARAEVNKFVQENFIYDKLRTSQYQDDSGNIKAGSEADYYNLIDSVERKYTYMDGDYPNVGPDDGITDAEGDKYYLTNKLDYVFYKHPTKKTVNADGTVTWTPMTAEAWMKDDTITDKGAVLYPYTNGWAVVPEDKVHSDDVDDIWTTFSTGELTDVDPIAFADKSLGEYKTGGASKYFKFQDFSQLEKKVYYVKACYEPGEKLVWNGNYKPISNDVVYNRYNYVDSSGNSSYSIKFQYKRENGGVGVSRARDLAIRVENYLDNNGTEGKYFYSEVVRADEEFIDIEIVVAGNIHRVAYTLVDRYDANFVTGVQRSVVNSSSTEVGLKSNFDYLSPKVDLNQDKVILKEEYEKRLGTDGFVYWGTLHQVLELAAAAADSGLASDWNKVSSALTAGTFNDLNLYNRNREEMSSGINVQRAYNTLKTMFEAAYAVGGKDTILSLDWHQLQHAILNDGAYTNKFQAVAADDGYDWCKWDDCGSTGKLEGGIDTIQDLLAALADTDNLAEDNLTETFRLRRKTTEGDTTYPDRPYTTAELNQLKQDLEPKVLIPAGSNYNMLSDEQVQYLLLGGDYSTMPPTDQLTGYWWLTEGGKYEINDLSSLLTTVDMVENQHYDSSWLSELSLTTAETLKLWASEDKNDHSFGSVEDLKAKLKTAITALKANGYTSEMLKSADWIEVQHLLIDSTHEYKDKDTLENNGGKIIYWWGYDTAEDAPTFPTPSIAELMTAADLADRGGSHAWDNLTVDILTQLYLMKEDKGGDGEEDLKTALEKGHVIAFTTEADKDSAGDAMRILVGNAKKNDPPVKIENITWKQIQHAIRNKGEYKEDDDISDKEAWWKEDGTGKRPGSLNTLDKLLDAAVKARDGDETAWDDLLLSDIMGLHLAKADKPEADRRTGDTFEHLVHFEETSLTEFTTKMEELAGESDNPMSLTWAAVQYYLIYGNIGTEEEITEAIFWDQAGNGSRPGKVVTYDPEGAAKEVVSLALKQSDWINEAGDNIGPVKALLKEKLADLGFRKPGGTQVYTDSEEDLTALANILVVQLGETMFWDGDESYYDSKSLTSKMSWKQVQYYILTGTLAADSSITDYPWKPGTASTSEWKAPILSLDHALARTEDTQVDTDTTTSFDEATGDVTITIVNTAVTTVVTTLEDRIVTTVTTVVTTNTIFISSESHQAVTSTDVTSDTVTTVEMLEVEESVPPAEETDAPAAEESQPPATEEDQEPPAAEEQQPDPEITDAPAAEETDAPTGEEPAEPPQETDAAEPEPEQPVETEPALPPEPQGSEDESTSPPQESEEPPEQPELDVVALLWLNGLEPRPGQGTFGRTALAQRC